MIWYYWLIVAVGILLVLILLRLLINSPTCQISSDLTGKLIIITGCTSGIGKEAALDLLNKGAEMIFANRDERKTNEILESLPENKRNKVRFMKIDMASFASVISFVNKFLHDFQDRKIDYLILNAGLVAKDFSLTKDKIEMTLQTNLLSNMLIIAGLVERLNNQGRVIITGSSGHEGAKLDFDFLENDMNFERLSKSYTYMNAYGCSKIGVLYLARNLIHFAQQRNIEAKFIVTHPGLVFTGIISSFNTNLCLKIVYYLSYPIIWYIMKSSWVGAQTMLYTSYEDYDKLVDGGYYKNCKFARSSQQSYDENKGKRYLKYCYNLINMNETGAEFAKNTNFFNFLREL